LPSAALHSIDAAFVPEPSTAWLIGVVSVPFVVHRFYLEAEPGGARRPRIA
jgi:hypothetical protein